MAREDIRSNGKNIPLTHHSARGRVQRNSGNFTRGSQLLTHEMLMWFSGGALPRLGVDADCLRSRLGVSASHDNVAHTLLGMAGVSTTVYRPQLDSLQGCRGMRVPSAATVQ
jgi:hypothetical protein